MMNPAWPERIDSSRAGRPSRYAHKTGLSKGKIRSRFWPGTEIGKMLRAGLYAPVSTNDQQRLPIQNRAMREYAAWRGWTNRFARS
jgi:hypothetical protein